MPKEAVTRYPQPGKQTNLIALADVLRTLPKRLPDDRTTLGEILAALRVRAHFSGLLDPAIIPTPGVPSGVVFGTALADLAPQMAAGSDRFRLPGWLAGRRLWRRRVEAFAHALPAGSNARASRGRRWTTLATPAAALGLVVVVTGIPIALPIPFGNNVPGLAVFLIALGLTERDGAAVALGLAAGVLAIAVAAGLV